MARRAAYIDRLREGNPGTPILHFDVGGLVSYRQEGRLIRLRTILEAYRRMGVAAVNISRKDIEALEAFESFAAEAAADALPLLSANLLELPGRRARLRPSVVVEAGTYKVGVVGLTERLGNSVTAPDGAELITAPPFEAAAEQVRALRGEVDLVVLLAYLEQGRLALLDERVGGVDLVLGADGYTFAHAVREAGDVVAAYSGRQGRNIGVFRVWMDGGSLERQSYELVSLARALPEDEGIRALVNDARQQIAELERLAAEALRTRVNPDYVGFSSCRSCHKEPYQAWRRSSHYAAFNPIISSRNVSRESCLGCHTTGHGEGGFVDVRNTPKMVHVQCEACHGPSGPHAADPAATRTPRPAPDVGVCIRCHDAANSPNFDFDAYWQQIAH